MSQITPDFYPDCLIRCNDGDLHAHTLYLRFYFKYFYELFNSPYGNDTLNIYIPENKDIVQFIIDKIYNFSSGRTSTPGPPGSSGPSGSSGPPNSSGTISKSKKKEKKEEGFFDDESNDEDTDENVDEDTDENDEENINDNTKDNKITLAAAITQLNRICSFSRQYGLLQCILDYIIDDFIYYNSKLLNLNEFIEQVKQNYKTIEYVILDKIYKHIKYKPEKNLFVALLIRDEYTILEYYITSTPDLKLNIQCELTFSQLKWLARWYDIKQEETIGKLRINIKQQS